MYIKKKIYFKADLPIAYGINVTVAYSFKNKVFSYGECKFKLKRKLISVSI